LQKYTERCETLIVWSNVLAEVNPKKILESMNAMMDKEEYW
jgi:hypothetical protein